MVRGGPNTERYNDDYKKIRILNYLYDRKSDGYIIRYTLLSIANSNMINYSKGDYILESALRGKLIPQDSGVDASVLLDSIFQKSVNARIKDLGRT